MSFIICNVNRWFIERAQSQRKRGISFSDSFQPAKHWDVKELRTSCLSKKGLSERWHTKSKCSFTAFLRFHPWINWLKEIVWNWRCVMRRHRSPWIFGARGLPCLRGAEILVCQSPGCNVQEGKIIPCQIDLALKCRGQLRSVLLRIKLCRVGIKRRMSHVCRIWFIWPWHLNPNNMNYDKSTGVRAIYCFTWPVSANQIALRRWVHDLSFLLSGAFVGWFFKYDSRINQAQLAINRT